MMLAHGLSSSGLFYMVNVYYRRTGRRSLLINNGMLKMIPIASLIVFMLCAANISAPPTLNLFSEFFLIISVLKFEVGIILFFPLGSFLGVVFILYLFAQRQHGKGGLSVVSFIGLTSLESIVLVVHLVPLNIIFIRGSIFI